MKINLLGKKFIYTRARGGQAHKRTVCAQCAAHNAHDKAHSEHNCAQCALAHTVRNAHTVRMRTLIVTLIV